MIVATMVNTTTLILTTPNPFINLGAWRLSDLNTFLMKHNNTFVPSFIKLFQTSLGCHYDCIAVMMSGMPRNATFTQACGAT